MRFSSSSRARALRRSAMNWTSPRMFVLLLLDRPRKPEVPEDDILRARSGPRSRLHSVFSTVVIPGIRKPSPAVGDDGVPTSIPDLSLSLSLSPVRAQMDDFASAATRRWWTGGSVDMHHGRDIRPVGESACVRACVRACRRAITAVAAEADGLRLDNCRRGVAGHRTTVGAARCISIRGADTAGTVSRLRIVHGRIRRRGAKVEGTRLATT